MDLGWVRGRSAAAVVMLVAVAVPVLGSPSGATAPVVRYASPTAQPTGDCSSLAPCPLDTAINDAPTGAVVDVEPGTYGSADVPIADTLDAYSHAVSLIGIGPGTPVVYESGNPAINVGAGSSLTNLQVVATSTGTVGLDLQAGTVDRFAMYAADRTACDVVNSGTLTNTVCWTNAAAAAVHAEFVSDGTIILAGVTAVASGTDGTGLQAQAEESGRTAGVVATNSIFVSPTGQSSVIGNAQPATTVTVALNNCDFATTSASPNGGQLTYSGANNVTAPPLFVNAPAQDFREAAGSPTINHGSAVPSSDSTDLAGNPRTIGAAPDIGAYEAQQKPTASALSVPRSKVTTKAATFRVKVGAGGAATTVTYRVSRHHHKTKVRTRSAGAGGSSVLVSYRLTGLRAHTSYRLKVTAKNALGQISTKSVKFTTRKPKPKHHR